MWCSKAQGALQDLHPRILLFPGWSPGHVHASAPEEGRASGSARAGAQGGTQGGFSCGRIGVRRFLAARCVPAGDGLYSPRACGS